MNVYQSTLINFLYAFLAINSASYVYIISIKNFKFKTSFVAGFLFFLSVQNFIQIAHLNRRYNYLNNKIKHI